MRNISCNLCGENNTKLKYKIGKYHLVECQNCGLVYLNPQPDENEIAKEYEDQKIVFSGGEEKILDDYLANKQKYWKDYKKRLAAIEKVFGVSKGKILDIGCAGGFFLDYLKYSGWQTYGVELSKWGAETCQKKLGLNVFNGNLNQANFKDNFFDVITMYDVLEHTQEPAKELIEVKRILKKDGLLIINVPNIDSFVSKLNKEKWNKLIPGQHLYFFTPQTLKKMLSKYNFTTISLKTLTGETKETGLQILGSPLGLASPSDSSKAVNFYRKHRKWLSWIKKVVKTVINIFSLIFIPFINWILIKFGKGEGINILARNNE